MSSAEVVHPITLRCSFCDTKNRIDISRAADRPACGGCSKPMPLDRPVTVTQDDFDSTVLGASVPVLVDFYADWCGPCKIVAPLMDEIAQAQSGKMLVVKVDTDKAPLVAERYGIRSIPTVILFQEGEEMERSAGFEPERVRDFAEKAVA